MLERAERRSTPIVVEIVIPPPVTCVLCGAPLDDEGECERSCSARRVERRG